MASGYLAEEVALGSIPRTQHGFWKSTLTDSELEASLSYISPWTKTLRSYSLSTGKLRQERCQVFLTSSGS